MCAGGRGVHAGRACMLGVCVPGGHQCPGGCACPGVPGGHACPGGGGMHARWHACPGERVYPGVCISGGCMPGGACMPRTPPCGQNDTSVKILPWRNFVAADNKPK